jgi:hypothetical protein
MYILRSKVLPSSKSYGRRDLTDGHGCCPRVYTMEGSPTVMQKRSSQPHLVECLQEKEVKGAASIYQHFVELDILYDGIDH